MLLPQLHPTAGDTVFKCCLQLSAQIFNYFESKSRVIVFCGKCPSGLKLLLFCRSFILWKVFSKVLKFNNVTSISISVAPFLCDRISPASKNTLKCFYWCNLFYLVQILKLSDGFPAFCFLWWYWHILLFFSLFKNHLKLYGKNVCLCVCGCVFTGSVAYGNQKRVQGTPWNWS